MSFIMIAFLFHRKLNSHLNFKRGNISSKVYYFVWLIMAIRLILPFDMSMNNPVYEFNSARQNRSINGTAYTDNKIPQPGENISKATHNKPLPVENTAAPLQENNNLTIFTFMQENIFSIWLLGALIYLFYHLCLYGLFRKKLTKSFILADISLEEKLSGLKTEMGIHKDLQLRKSGLIDSPMIAGLIKPVLLLPCNIDMENIDNIFRHELVHFKRNDIAYKGVIFLATVIHWFNPLVHLMLKIAGQDLEFSCDEEVVEGMSKKERTDYCKTLINSISRKRVPLYTTNFSGGKKMMKQRMDTILNAANNKISKSLIFLLIVSIFTTSFLIGCNPSKRLETQADILYGYKTPYIGDNSKVANILSNLDFPQGYTYDSIVLLTDAEPYRLQINCITDNESDVPGDKFNFLSAIVFSLVGNLDEIQYTPKNDSNYSQTGYITNRKNIDGITLSVMGKNTAEIGNDQDKFQELLEVYTNYAPLPPQPIDTSLLNPTPYEIVDNLDDVIMTAKQGSIQKTGLTLLLENQSKSNIIYGDDFTLEQKVDGIWYEVPITLDGDYGFHDIAYEVLSKEIREFKIEWGWLYGVLEPGEYRITKYFIKFGDFMDFANDQETQEFDSDYLLTAEFKI